MRYAKRIAALLLFLPALLGWAVLQVPIYYVLFGNIDYGDDWPSKLQDWAER